MKTSNESPAALLIVDMINDFAFPRGTLLAKRAKRITPTVLRLRDAFDHRRLPVVYCNDNFGRWRADFREILELCTASSNESADIRTLLQPAASHYIVLKPRHSAFYATPLDLLLQSLDVESVVIAGIATDLCVLATAWDAHLRNYRCVIVSDATAAQTDIRQRRTLDHVRSTRAAEVLSSSRLLASLG